MCVTSEPVNESAVADVEQESLPFYAARDEPLTMTWNDLSFFVTKNDEKQELLSGIHGSVSPGELLAIMGPSGAGKSTMMNVLAARATYGEHTGSILINGNDPKKFTKSIAYVMQEDALFPSMTPRECLELTAALKLHDATEEERKRTVDSVLSLLGLHASADRRIASIPGEKKRVAVAVELVSSPSLIFLDEPTSHLDSFSAYELVRHLRTLSRAGATIVCTIHQPSSEVFHIFDKVMLLARGKCVYNGPVRGVAEHFATAGFICKSTYNPADFAMNQLQIRTNEELAPLVAETTKRSASALEQLQVGGSAAERAARAKAPFWTQCMLLTKRDAVQLSRNKDLLGARFGMAIGQSLLIGLFFLDVGHEWGTGSDRDAMAAVRTHWSALQFIMINTMFLTAQPVLLAFPSERPIFLREHATGTYSTTPYFIAKTLVEVPAGILQNVIQLLICFWMIDLQGNFLYILLSSVIFGFVISSVAMLLSALTTRAETAINLMPLVFIPQMLASGIFLSVDGMPSWLRWLQWVCPLKYGIALATTGELATKYVPDNREWLVDNLMDSSDVDFDLWVMYLLLLVGLFVLFRLAALAALIYRASDFS